MKRMLALALLAVTLSACGGGQSPAQIQAAQASASAQASLDAELSQIDADQARIDQEMAASEATATEPDPEPAAVAFPTGDWCADIATELNDVWSLIRKGAPDSAILPRLGHDGRVIRGLRTETDAGSSLFDYQLAKALLTLSRTTDYDTAVTLGQTLAFVSGEIQGFCSTQGYDPADYPTGPNG